MPNDERKLVSLIMLSLLWFLPTPTDGRYMMGWLEEIYSQIVAISFGPRSHTFQCLSSTLLGKIQHGLFP